VMCGPQAKTMRVPLTFLGDGSYKTTLVRDDPADDATVRVENATHQKGDTLTLELRAGGGFVAQFTK